MLYAGTRSAPLDFSFDAHEIRMDALSAFWAAVNYLGKNRVNRDLLPPGTAEVELTISGSVRAKGLRKKQINETFVGLLDIGEPQTAASSSAPDAAHVIALLIDKHPKGAEVLRELETYFAEKGELKPIEADKIKTVDLVLKRLRQVETKTKAGSITFKVTANE